MNKTGTSITYKYNDGGIRTQKTVNGVAANYYTDGANVIYETKGSDTFYYTYDAGGNLISFNLNGAEYYYVRNGQNDIIGLLDNTGAKVANYVYDSWGKLISITDANGNVKTTDITFVGYKNPYRYRGYRYDSETALYYLQSRYYDPVTCRFINADSQLNPGTGLTGANLFAYCGNNPVGRIDPNGHYWDSASGLLMMSPFSLQASFAPPSKVTGFMSTGGSGKVSESVIATANKKSSTTASKILTVVSAAGDVGIETWASQNYKPKLCLHEFRIWTMDYNKIAAVSKTAGKVGGIVSLFTLTIDVFSDCTQYAGNDLGYAIGFDAAGFGAGIGTGYVIGALALSCTNPYSLAVVGTVVVATVVSGLIINEGVSSAKNKYLTRK